jgi:hypothetical protein
MKPPLPDWSAYVREAARLAGLSLSPRQAAGVSEHFARLAGQGERLMRFPLPEGEEPADVYEP